jgi:hypothetical protein
MESAADDRWDSERLHTRNPMHRRETLNREGECARGAFSTDGPKQSGRRFHQNVITGRSPGIQKQDRTCSCRSGQDSRKSDELAACFQHAPSGSRRCDLEIPGAPDPGNSP